MITRTFGTLLLVAGIAAAQQAAMEEAIRKQVAEISRLMRESERLLLEITRVDRLVEAQRQVEEELRKLIPPDQQQPEGAAGAEERARQRQQLEAKHDEIGRRLEEMLEGERQKAELTVQQLEELLKNLPRQQQQMDSGGGSEPPPRSAEEEKRLREREEEEKKQHQPKSPREQRDDPKQQQQQRRTDKRWRDDPAAARMKRVEAWIARLPPEDQERINRNDFSRIPSRYRKLVEEYTAQRAKREAEREPDADR